MKRFELHRHMDASLRPSTLLELAIKHGLASGSEGLAAFKSRFMLTKPLSGLLEVLSKFELFQKVLDSPETLERIAREAVEDCAAEGIAGAELRFSPSFTCGMNGLDWTEALDAFERGLRAGLAAAPKNMRAGFICIASREFGPDKVAETVEFFMRHRSRFIGLDLAGDEEAWPCRVFERTFKPARDAGANITIHSGEASGPANIWEAIECLGARRIGHGINCVRDPKLMRHLADHRICLEICPTSNWITQSVPTLAAHPLPAILRAGIPVCINTDDPGIFDNTLDHEISVCREHMGMTDAEITECFRHAEEHTMLL